MRLFRKERKKPVEIIKPLEKEETVKFFKRKKKTKIVYRAIMDCQYKDKLHAVKMFKAGEALPDGWETGHPGFDRFRAEDNIMSRERKLKAKAAKYA